MLVLFTALIYLIFFGFKNTIYIVSVLLGVMLVAIVTTLVTKHHGLDKNESFYIKTGEKVCLFSCYAMFNLVLYEFFATSIFNFILFPTIIVFTFFLVYAVFLASFISAIQNDLIYKIEVDRIERVFKFYYKDKTIKEVSFDKMASIRVKSGSVIRGVGFSHLIFETSNGEKYRVTASPLSKTAKDILSKFNSSYETKLFYNPNWNKI